MASTENILSTLDHPGIPRFIETFKDDKTVITVREYVEGLPLHLYVKKESLDQDEIIDICMKLCDILSYLHHREEPIIHRDIKPHNVIIGPDKKVSLIDFDIARIYRQDNETDTIFFGTQAYAPPEQYGFSQTDVRADIYSLGVLLRFLLTGDHRENKNIRLYRPLEKIIKKCTAFDPNERYKDIDQVKKALSRANPRSQRLHMAAATCCVILLAVLIGYGSYKAYKVITYDPFNSDAIPVVLNDEDRVNDAIEYMKEKYGTTFYDQPDNLATVKLLRDTLIQIYGLDSDYVYGNYEEAIGELPGESDDHFFPWILEDDQYLDRDYTVYAAVKVHDPSIVADWSSLKDDTGEYPGVRVAEAFAEKTGILTGANRPKEITTGELALIFANADRFFEAAK